MTTYSKDDFGIVIDGQLHSVDWMPYLVDSLSNKVLNNIISKIDKKLQTNPPDFTSDARNYTVGQVAKMTNKSVSTITRHCRIGLLKASKVGKSWLIREKDYIIYRDNVDDE
ncbi:hypothetical protein FNO01nite_09440 [Flavobacterium noncentrifugens]|uniref:Helix-turn-helix domain-containing protein n=1 Tax=Flavobacterium noncentrifugens TaxID=1128970 RepID=A0A1G8UZ42_9FLAO|nr:helix-turn-helix domain-containing protein [Flavobacterium noncentrifugens]GEP50272.1 hypothetical protein FNO01nite_09440 [Flavobacterium noncentrifugens]SDJ59063.1 Helix-turn-helix domain-containing protein [Flavobacterium noncentrifugens]